MKLNEKKKNKASSKTEDFIDPMNNDYLYRNYSNLGDDEKQLMNCDETFAFYLFTVSQKVKKEFYL